jgi:G3E family GTPase
MKNFGEFFNDQIEHASSIILSHTDNTTEEKLETALDLIKQHNSNAVVITTPLQKLDGSAILDAIGRKNTLEAQLEELSYEAHHHHHHHHHEHDEHCDCHEHHHEHHHDHGPDCTCGCHDHHEHHHHHHADEIFTSWGKETTNKYSVEEITNILKALSDEHTYGFVLRAKGIVESASGDWIHFDYVPNEPDVRIGTADVIGRLCVIGSKIDESTLEKLFRIN